jgi:hypothetical protein
MQGIEGTLKREGRTLPPGKDWSDVESTLAVWTSRGGKYGARLVRNYAGAAMVFQEKAGRPIGTLPVRGDDAAALAYARAIMPHLFDVIMLESTQ